MGTGPDAFDTIVIGAGAYGASVGYHLAAAGQRVALMDRRPFGAETSARAAGLAVQVRSLAAFGRIAKRSVAKLTHFEEETGEPLQVSQAGSLAVARNEEAEQRVREHPALGARYDLEVELVEPRDAQQLAPYARFESARAISFTATDLHLEPGDLPRAYIRAASRRGLVTLEGVEAGGLIVTAGRVTGVRSERGPLWGDAVVNCAGGWIGLVDPAAGAVPVQPVRHQLIVTTPLECVADGHASVRVVDANTYARPCWGGLMFGGYESQPLFLSDGELPRSVAALTLDERPIRELVTRVSDAFPFLRETPIRELRGGIPTLTADGHPIIGELPGVGGAYVVGGCNVGGLSTSPAIGEAMAEWIVSARRPDVLEPFAPGRFAGRPRDELLAAARAKYAATEYG